MLADYVIALVAGDTPKAELRAKCNDSLSDILGNRTLQLLVCVRFNELWGLYSVAFVFWVVSRDRVVREHVARCAGQRLVPGARTGS